ncbi:MAG: hypothetical protein KJ630_00210 [Proteobacteria bacterium]|nr:hypothetical protein [Pseudomonadota bacterium]
MIFETGLARRQKLSGILAMILLVAALMAFVDAMIGGLSGNSGTIALIPGSRFLISGPMPPKTEAIAHFVIEGQPADDSLRLIPEAIFSGYWFGGSMWRGAIVVSPDARDGNYTLVVKDRFGEKQNPALVFTVRIWPDLATQNAHSPSFLTRKTGLSPFVFAGGFLLGGIIAGCLNFFLGWLWARHLASRNCGEIYILRRIEQGTEVTCEVQKHIPVRLGMPCSLYRRFGEALGSAVITDCENNKVCLLVKEAKLVKIGDVVSFQEG